MDAKTRRVMKAKQGKIAIGSGNPGGSEGYEGQVQVRDTKDGPMLFAKLNGKWIQSPLSIGGDFFIPKAFTTDIVLPSAAGKPCFVVPNFIPLRGILNVSILAEVKTASATYFYQMPIGYHAIGAAADWLVAIKTNDRTLYMSRIGDPTFIDLKAKLTIFYK